MPKLNLQCFSGDDADGEHPFEEYTDPKQRRHVRTAALRPPAKTPTVVVEQDDSQRSFNFTYQAARHERGWLIDSLGGFYEHQWFDDVLRLVRSGKEASVYQCQGLDPGDATTGMVFLAAKVYRPRSLRNLKNDSLYREGRDNLDEDGRVIRDDRMLRAIRTRTAFGSALRHTSWLAHEYTTMQVLHAAGADVPVPYANGENALLMSYIGDDLVAAPTLNTVELTPQEARPLFERVVHNLELMLANGRVHGDLSAYNILYWEGDITLIDFPQAVAPEENRVAFSIFQRDVRRVCEYFARQGVKANPHRLAERLWLAYGYRLSPEVPAALLNEDDPRDRAEWQAQRR